MRAHLRSELGYDSVEPGSRHPIISERFWSMIDRYGTRRRCRGDGTPNLFSAVVVGLAPSYSVDDLGFAECLIEAATAGLCSSLHLFDVLDVRDMQDIEEFLPGFGRAYQTPMVGIWANGLLVSKGQGNDARRLVEAALGIVCER